MEIIIATMKVKPDKIAEFEALGRKLVAATRKEPGCRLYRLHKLGADTYVFYEEYADPAAVAAHMGGPALREAMGQFGTLLAGPPKIERPTVVE